MPDLPLADGFRTLDDFERERQTRLLGRFQGLPQPALREGEMLLFGPPASR
jgi:hypothetical protein